MVFLSDRTSSWKTNVNKQDIVKLTLHERADLRQMISGGKAAARKLLRARILLKADASPEGPEWSKQHDDLIARRRARPIALTCSPAPAWRVHWMICLFAKKPVEAGYVEQIGRATLRRLREQSCLSPQASGWKRFCMFPYACIIRTPCKSVWARPASS